MLVALRGYFVLLFCFALSNGPNCDIFAWNDTAYFLGQIRKYYQFGVCYISSEGGKVWNSSYKILVCLALPMSTFMFVVSCFRKQRNTLYMLTRVPQKPDMPCLCKQCRFRSVGF